MILNRIDKASRFVAMLYYVFQVANAILDTVDNCMEAPGSQLLAGQNQKNVSKR